MANDKPLVISLCDRTTNAVKPWAEAGYECWAVDIQHPDGMGEAVDGIRKIGMDIRKFELPLGRKIAFVFGWPPCTHLAVSGARWFKGKGLNLLSEAIGLVARCADLCNESGAPYMIENPVGTLSTYWRQPDHKFDPNNYALYATEGQQIREAYSKKTCLWTGGGFVMPEHKSTPPFWQNKIHYAKGRGKDRANERSETPTGFSRAVFEANHKPGSDPPAD